MDVLQGINLSEIKVAKGGDRVYKEECVFSFDTPESPDGLYVSLNSLIGISKQWLDLWRRKTGEVIYLNIKRIVKQVKQESEEAEGEKPTRLAIGVEGGFTGGIEKVEYEEHYQLLVNSTLIPLPCQELPTRIQDSIAAIIAAESASKQDEISAWEEPLIVTKHADTLVQLDNGVKIPMSGWKCSKCDLTNNLWLNLTDGSILCGRRYYDGSGGNNHAVEYYDSTKYPLAVKLGTITPGGADVYSYDEDSMVIDPNLPLHLSHFGINMMVMNKTDKTMTELQIDANIKLGEWSVIQESGHELKLVYGAGYTGLQNLGNSCYMNSTLQVLFSLPEFKARYYDTAVATFESGQNDPTKDFNTQMCKVGSGLLSGDYSQAPPTDESGLQKEQIGIKINMFKTLIGMGHREFSSNRQQDAQEFILHLLSNIDRAEHATRGTTNVVNLFRHQIEEKIICTVSGKVKYSAKPELLLTLPVPMAAATNLDEVVAWEQRKQQLKAEKKPINPDDIVRAKVPFSTCLLQYSTPTDIPDFFSTALQAKSPATRMYRFKTFPEYLIIQLAKFAFDDNWVPVKFDVEVDVPDCLDLSYLKAQGIQPGELELPEGDTPQAQTAVAEIDENIVSQLMDMGFGIEGCKRAVYNTKNQGVEPAMNWILEHMEDPDFNSPFVIPGTTSNTSSISEENIMLISSLGFTREQAIKALKSTDNSVERAADWVFSHMEELNSEEVGGAEMEQEQFLDGIGKYHLIAFISHMGTSAMTGHYVCHVLKDGKWIIYNDTKVAESLSPPKGLGYLYFYQREKQ